ncbi:MAG TPA: UDP-N-acetylglucosamine 2-epimerase (non-hydrolyzing) [Ignavibacteriaceae bacterium]|nr:UDP-N-acetylglucosamine 2-epimerase (non-hydrolyzing) [Ignavibacteriaceae bacterium]
MKSKLKVMTIVGTRPEIIRLSRVITLLDETVNHILVHTGQNYDYELNEIFFNELEIRKPDHFLNADVSSLGATIGDIMKRSEEVMKKENPDALLVLGDTNSCLSAYIAKRMKIPIYHMEAGNRCFDFNVPEEINRRVIDHISDFNLVYTEHARRHLLSEGLPHRRIYLTGSPMNEVLSYYLPRIESSKILDDLALVTNHYFLVSIHREENVDNPENLKILLNTLNEIANIYNKRIIISTHPRTRKRIDSLITNHQSPVTSYQLPVTSYQSPVTSHQSLEFLKPFGFYDYNKLQMNALCVLSDSGTINEESSILNFPAITLRNSMERPEGLDTGSIIITGLNTKTIIDSITLVLYEKDNNIEREWADDYKVLNTSMRVVKLIMGTSKLSNKWNGIEVRQKTKE